MVQFLASAPPLLTQRAREPGDVVLKESVPWGTEEGREGWRAVACEGREDGGDREFPAQKETVKMFFRFALLLFSHLVVSDSLRPQGLQHARLPCPSPTPGACSNSCPSSQ